MSVSFVGSATNHVASGTSLTIAKPAGTAVGDVLVAVIEQVFNGSTPPAGWTYALNYASGREAVLWRVVDGTEAANFTWTLSTSQAASGAVLTYRGVDTANPILAAAFGSHRATTNPMSAPSLSVSQTGQLLIGFAPDNVTPGTPTPTGLTLRASQAGGFSDPGVYVYDTPVTAGSTSAYQSDIGTGGWAWSSFAVVLNEGNNPPNAPTLTSPASNATIDSTSSQRFAWDFSDPDPGDSQSAFDLQYWALDANGARVGAATTVNGSTPNQFYTFAAGTFADGDYEWQARTYDDLGAEGPWSASSFFTAATPTGVPTITDPINGATVGTNAYNVQWSTAGGQAGYRVRRVADNAGAADATTVYWDSGQVTDANARSLSVPFETNGRYEHVQVQVTADGTLWSSWADVRVYVSYTAPAPATGSLSFDQASGSLLVTITNGTPSGSQPQNSYNDVLVDDGDGLETKNGSTLLPLNQPYRYYLPVSGRDYSGNVVVRVVGTNGVSTDTTIN